MPLKLLWTNAQDTRIRRLRAEGAPWDLIAVTLCLRSFGCDRTRPAEIGARSPPPEFVPHQTTQIEARCPRGTQNLGAQ